MEEQLLTQDKVAQNLKSLRHLKGALDLETIQSQPVFVGDTLTDLKLEQKNRAKELIEDFMIAANGVTANYLKAKQVPSLRRVVRAPERWQRIVALAASMNEKLPPEPDAVALDAFLARRRQADPLRFPDLSLTVVKLMGRGEYAVNLPGEQSQGHFGLSVEDYTHSTAPNRRFPDLLTQRMLKCAISGQPPPYSVDKLKQLAQHCSAQEDAAAKVERQVRKSAAALLLENRIGERFDAIVTGASEKGTWVRIFNPPIEGKLMVGKSAIHVGTRILVHLLSVDVEHGFIDFAL
jgi:exoribonuclease R